MFDDISILDWIEKLQKIPSEILEEHEFKVLCEQVTQILAQENNVLNVRAPVTICGDIHGQFSDLIKLFSNGPSLPESAYIFLGDYVDRGHKSVETCQLLFLLKLRYPNGVNLLRGNHESRGITRTYGFYDECLVKYGNSNVWKHCTSLFQYLPLAALVDDTVYCVHGGLSPDLPFLDQVRALHRYQEIPASGAMSDILWSDPGNIIQWAPNPRGMGWTYGEKPVDEFNHINGNDLIARAHQLVDDGFRFMFRYNSCVTVWSAPNYCYRCGNRAAILHLDENLSRLMIVFDESIQSSTEESTRAAVPYFL